MWDFPNLGLTRPQKLFCTGWSLKLHLLLLTLFKKKVGGRGEIKKKNHFGKAYSRNPSPGVSGRCSRLNKSLQCTMPAPPSPTPLPAAEVLLQTRRVYSGDAADLLSQRYTASRHQPHRALHSNSCKCCSRFRPWKCPVV